MLSEVASELNIGDLMLLSKGEAKSLGKARQYILANAFEAIIGAVYLGRGYEETFGFLEKNLFGKIEEVIEKKLWIDAKSLFQEKAQEIESITPSYKVLAESGPDHEKVLLWACFWAMSWWLERKRRFQARSGARRRPKRLESQKLADEINIKDSP